MQELTKQQSSFENQVFQNMMFYGDVIKVKTLSDEISRLRQQQKESLESFAKEQKAQVYMWHYWSSFFFFKESGFSSHIDRREKELHDLEAKLEQERSQLSEDRKKVVVLGLPVFYITSLTYWLTKLTD